MIKLNHFLAFVALTLVTFYGNAQTPEWVWAKSFGGVSGDDSRSIALDKNGNVYTTGIFNGTTDFDPGAGVYSLTSDSSYDIFISKLNSDGNFVWAKIIGGLGTENSRCISTDPAGNIYLTGYFEDTVDFDPGPATHSLISNGLSDIFIVKFDSLGNYLWGTSIGGTGYDNGYSSTTDASGHFFFTGVFSGSVDFDPGPGSILLNGTNGGVCIAKMDTTGNMIWAKAIDGNSGDFSQSIVVNSNGEVCTIGYFNGFTDFDPGPGVYTVNSPGVNSVFVSKLDSSGDFIWAKVFKGTNYAVGQDLAVDGIGSVYLTGAFTGTTDFDPDTSIYNLTSHGINDFFIAKLDSGGNFRWAMSAGGSSNDYGYTLVLDRSANVYTAGCFTGSPDFDPGTAVYSLYSAGSFDIFLSKLDSAGNFKWAMRMGKYYDEIAESMEIDANDNVYLTGFFKSDTISFTPYALANSDLSGFYPDAFVTKLDTNIVFTGSNEFGNLYSHGICFPNPASDLLNITPGIVNQPYNVCIYDLTGGIVYESFKNRDKNLEINTSNIAEGIYFLKLQTFESEKTYKIVITK